MNSTGFDLVAKNIQSQRLRLVADYSSSQRNLIEALYKAYLRLQGEMVNYVKVTTYGESADICDKIYKWYKDHYVNKTGKTKNRVMTSRNKAMIFFAILIYLQIINDGCIVLT